MSAITIANAESHPNSLSEGRSDSTVTAKPHASTTVVKISGGPMSTVARATPIPASWSGRSSSRSRFRKWMVALSPSPKDTVKATMLANCSPRPSIQRSTPEVRIGKIAGSIAASITIAERKASPINAATKTISMVRALFSRSIMLSLFCAAMTESPVTEIW